ncbi:hypothetical protein BH18ACT8_BH18ACT8_09740 [soil metagenome]
MSRAALTPEQLTSLLDDLARRLHDRGAEGDLLLVGGAAMALRHGARRLTRDVDGRGEPADLIAELAREIAREHGLRDDWLNARAMAFLPPIGDEDRELLSERPGLRIETVSARVLLAMKMAAFRATDRSDLELLFVEVNISHPQHVVRMTRDAYGEHSMVLPEDADEDLYLQAEEILERLGRGLQGRPQPPAPA